MTGVDPLMYYLQGVSVRNSSGYEVQGTPYAVLLSPSLQCPELVTPNIAGPLQSTLLCVRGLGPWWSGPEGPNPWLAQAAAGDACPAGRLLWGAVGCPQAKWSRKG